MTVRGWWKLLGFVAVAAAAAIIAVHQGGALAGLDDHQQVSLLYRVGLLILVASALAHVFRGRYGDIARMTLVWVGIILAFAVGYSYRTEVRTATNRIMAELAPALASARALTVVEVPRTGSDFHVGAMVNGQTTTTMMVVDTGASMVMLTYDAAFAAGVPVDVLKYDVNIETANGRAAAAKWSLRTIAIPSDNGVSIVEHRVPALIAPPGTLKTSLLGMSFLSRLEGFEVKRNKLVLRGSGSSRSASLRGEQKSQ